MNRVLGDVLQSQTREVDEEELRVGDIVLLWCGLKRITAIHPYGGPFCTLGCFAIAEYVPADQSCKGGFSLWHGQRVLRVD